MKVRIKFEKSGNMKFIGHLDIMRYFQKVMRRADVDIAYSEGFSPHQIMSFAAPLGVGLTSKGEYLDIEVHHSDNSEAMVKRLNDTMVEGMKIVSYRELPNDSKNAMSIVAQADYLVQFRQGHEPFEDWEKSYEQFLNRKEIIVTKATKKSEKVIDIRPNILESYITKEHKIFMKVTASSADNLKPDLVMKAYFDEIGKKFSAFDLEICRLEIYGMQDNQLIPLEDFGEDIIE